MFYLANDREYFVHYWVMMLFFFYIYIILKSGNSSKGIQIRKRYNWMFVAHFYILIFNEISVFVKSIWIMQKQGYTVTFMKYFVSAAALISLLKTLIWNKITFLTKCSSFGKLIILFFITAKTIFAFFTVALKYFVNLQ